MAITTEHTTCPQCGSPKAQLLVNWGIGVEQVSCPECRYFWTDADLVEQEFEAQVEEQAHERAAQAIEEEEK